MTLTAALQNAINSAVWKAMQNNRFQAKLGKGDDAKTLYAERAGFVWARVSVPGGSSVMQVRNTKVANDYGKDVWITRAKDNVWEIDSNDDSTSIEFYGGRVGGNTGTHGLNHGYFGSDPILVAGRQFLPLLAMPNSPPDLSIRVYPCILYLPDGTAVAFAGGNIDIASHVPSSANEQRIVIVGYDINTNSLTATAGTAKTVASTDVTRVPFSDSEAASITLTDGIVAILAVRLYNAQTVINIHDCFLDMRPYFTLPWLNSGGESGGEYVPPGGFSQLRLTTITANPVPSGNNSASATIYYTNYTGWKVRLRNTTSLAWEDHLVSGEISASIAGLTASTLYDVFVDSTEALTFVAWTGTTARATALGDVEGIRVMASDNSKLYIGKILIDSGGGTVTQSMINQGVSNYYNRVKMDIGTFPSANTWSYNSATIREWGGGAAGAGAVHVTMATEPYGFVHASMLAACTAPAANQGAVGFGLNTTTAFSSPLINTSQQSRTDYLNVHFDEGLGEGLNTLYANERCQSAGGTVTSYGDANIPTYFQMGFSGFVVI